MVPALGNTVPPGFKNRSLASKKLSHILSCTRSCQRNLLPLLFMLITNFSIFLHLTHHTQTLGHDGVTLAVSLHHFCRNLFHLGWEKKKSTDKEDIGLEADCISFHLKVTLLTMHWYNSIS